MMKIQNDYNDLIKGLRCECALCGNKQCDECEYDSPVFFDTILVGVSLAADAIEQLQAENERLEAKQSRDEARALSLEELKELPNGSWVWIVDKNIDLSYSGWAQKMDNKIFTLLTGEHIGYTTKDLSDKYYCKYYKKEWVTFNRQPKEAGL